MYFTEWTVHSRTVFAGHRCLQVQGHRQRCQCQCPVTNAQRPPLLYPAAYFMSLILQGSPALLNTWPCWRTWFQQAIWTHALPTALHVSPSLAHCSLRNLPTLWLICDLQGDYWNLLHLSKVWWTHLSTPSLWLYLAIPLSNSYLAHIFPVKDQPQ